MPGSSWEALRAQRRVFHPPQLETTVPPKGGVPGLRDSRVSGWKGRSVGLGPQSRVTVGASAGAGEGVEMGSGNV